MGIWKDSSQTTALITIGDGDIAATHFKPDEPLAPSPGLCHHGQRTVLDKVYMKLLQGRQAKALAGQKTLPFPVISVGNITVGGAGKTPFTLWLARQLAAQGHTVGVASRGYPLRLEHSCLVQPEDTPAQVSDEGALLARSLQGVAHVAVGPNRYESGELLRREKNISVLVLDDGFQHLWLKRDLDIVLLNAHQPFGNSRLLPFGPLREPTLALCRAQALVLTGLEGVTPAARQALANRFATFNPHGVVAGGGVAVEGVVDAENPGALLPAEVLKGKEALLVCAIARPERFVETARRLGVVIRGQKIYRDHHGFSLKDKSRLQATVPAGGVLLCTEKDLVKLMSLGPWQVPLMAPRIRWRFEWAEEDLTNLLPALFHP